MYNQQVSWEAIKCVEIRRTSNGTEVILKKGGRAKARKSKMYTLWQFRELFIPDEGLWSHYFSCPKCGWERRNPIIAICRYCERPMVEIGCPAFHQRMEGKVEVLKLRPDLQRELEEEIKRVEEEKNKDVVRQEGGVTIFRIEL